MSCESTNDRRIREAVERLDAGASCERCKACRKCATPRVDQADRVERKDRLG